MKWWATEANSWLAAGATLGMIVFLLGQRRQPNPGVPVGQLYASVASHGPYWWYASPDGRPVYWLGDRRIGSIGPSGPPLRIERHNAAWHLVHSQEGPLDSDMSEFVLMNKAFALLSSGAMSGPVRSFRPQLRSGRPSPGATIWWRGQMSGRTIASRPFNPAGLPPLPSGV